MYHGTYRLIGAELSMFTRKLEAQLRYQNIPHAWRFKSMAEGKELEKRSGTLCIRAGSISIMPSTRGNASGPIWS